LCRKSAFQLFTEVRFAKVPPVVLKAKRLQILLQRLQASPAASSAGDAFGLLAGILNTVEDELSEVPNRPELWKTDGRMYPLQEDSRVKFPARPWRRTNRNKGHYTFIGINGSIRIETLDASFVINPAGTGEKLLNWRFDWVFLFSCAII
jgi:hypothetical protein